MRTISFTFASFCRITALAVLSFSLAGCGLMDYGGGGSGTRGTKTYTVRGKTYRPYLSADGYREDGVASWYGRDFHGKTTANGERYNMYAMTAAHKLLPLGTKVRVTHLRNGKSIVVRVNDRGPFVGDRIIDLSYASAKELGMIGTGTARVRRRYERELLHPDRRAEQPSLGSGSCAAAAKPESRRAGVLRAFSGALACAGRAVQLAEPR